MMRMMSGVFNIDACANLQAIQAASQIRHHVMVAGFFAKDRQSGAVDMLKVMHELFGGKRPG